MGSEIKRDEEVVIKGYAYGDGDKGTQAVKVQLSFDEGKTWEDAHHYVKENKPEGKVFSWTLWRYEIKGEELLKKLDISDNKDQIEVSVLCRAIGSDGELQ